MCQIIAFHKPQKQEYQCFWCKKAFKRRSELNTPAYCSYECAGFGQPEHTKPALRHDYSGNNLKS